GEVDPTACAGAAGGLVVGEHVVGEGEAAAGDVNAPALAGADKAAAGPVGAERAVGERDRAARQIEPAALAVPAAACRPVGAESAVREGERAAGRVDAAALAEGAAGRGGQEANPGCERHCSRSSILEPVCCTMEVATARARRPGARALHRPVSALL